MIKAWARFAEAFWAGFESARAQSEARTQPAPIAAGLFEGLTEDEIKSSLAAALRGSHDEGVSTERARIAEILQLPGASKFQDLVVDLALGGDATPAQVAMVISRTEVHVQARLHPTEPLPLESSTPTLH
jgi:hypothetical protein